MIIIRGCNLHSTCISARRAMKRVFLKYSLSGEPAQRLRGSDAIEAVPRSLSVHVLVCVAPRTRASRVRHYSSVSDRSGTLPCPPKFQILMILVTFGPGSILKFSEGKFPSTCSPSPGLILVPVQPLAALQLPRHAASQTQHDCRHLMYCAKLQRRQCS